MNTGRYEPARDKFIVRILCEFPALMSRKLTQTYTKHSKDPKSARICEDFWPAVENTVIDLQRKAER